MTSEKINPLVSVIIPCYNHGKYLSSAIKSILCQSYTHYEIIIVDDGSTDDTQTVARKFPGIHYLYQSNAGLSAARNAGIKISKGEYLIFLDADDWLCDDAILQNVNILMKNHQMAFISGAHRKVNKNGIVLEDVNRPVEKDHYQHLLQGNYIGMHATVMYQRWVFDTFEYDTTLNACEDYDLYLKISKQYPVLHHHHYIAEYLIHDTNMSGDIPLMLRTVLMVLKRQRRFLSSKKEWKCYRNGLAIWKGYYTVKMYEKLSVLSYLLMLKRTNELTALLLYNKRLFLKLIFQFPYAFKKNL
jgi:glycosyltransferase involved in cell wall biosynthesis